MRSRYTAYATGDLNHIIATTHPLSPHHQENRKEWADDIRVFCQTTTFQGLEVQSINVDGERAWVQFTAKLVQEHRPTSMQENSAFLRVEGRWLYVRGIETD